jgi:two-component system, NtrC family, sensor kinase
MQSETTPPSAPQRSSAPDSSSGLFAKRLGRSFARVVVVATTVCALLLSFLIGVANSVHRMQLEEVAIRTALGLATSIREQYIHAAHTLIIGDRSHLDHYAEWVQRVLEGTTALRASVPAGERWRLDRIEAVSREMDRLFTERVVPAVLAGDRQRMLEAHGELEQKVAAAAADADWITRSVEGLMSHEHVSATRATYTGVFAAIAGIVVLTSLSVISTRALRDAVLRPLAALVEAATRIGEGDLSARVVIAPDGELGVVARAFDRMAAQLAEHQRRLISIERMAAIGQLAAGVAHEINNPIGVIRGYLRTMIPEAEREDLRKELSILDEEAAACQRIADDLVAYARAPEISRTDVEIASLLRSTGERFEASGESRGSAIRVGADESFVLVDPVRIRQVLQNLLRNAVQAAAPGSPIEVRGEQTSSAYVISVMDRGVGVPDEHRTRIFEPFLSGRIHGTGLGLAVCKSIVRAHGGTIEVQPRDGGGSKFVVELPRSGASSARA